MSSRILRAAGEQRVEPIVWPAVGKTAEAAQTRRAAGPVSDSQKPQPELERHAREAYETGFRDGEAAGKSQADPVIDQVGRTIAALAELRSRLRREAESDLVKLAVAIARRILRRELTVDPDALEGLIKAALERLQAQEICRVWVHPQQEAAVRHCLERMGPVRNVELIPDGARRPGDVVFETTRGNLDASVETQLQEIERGLADCLRRRTGCPSSQSI